MDVNIFQNPHYPCELLTRLHDKRRGANFDDIHIVQYCNVSSYLLLNRISSRDNTTAYLARLLTCDKAEDDSLKTTITAAATTKTPDRWCGCSLKKTAATARRWSSGARARARAARARTRVRAMLRSLCARASPSLAAPQIREQKKSVLRAPPPGRQPSEPSRCRHSTCAHRSVYIMLAQDVRRACGALQHGRSRQARLLVAAA
jgi:hypothetical protein